MKGDIREVSDITPMYNPQGLPLGMCALITKPLFISSIYLQPDDVKF